MSPFGATRTSLGCQKNAVSRPPPALPERHQQLAVGRELVDLMPDGRWRRRWRARGTTSAAKRARAIGDPDVAVLVDGDPVRRLDQARSKVRDQISVGVELENRIERRADAVVDAAPLGDPDAGAVLVDVDGARRSPGATLGHLRPALDGLIGIGAIVDGSDRALRGHRRRARARSEREVGRR